MITASDQPEYKASSVCSITRRPTTEPTPSPTNFKPILPNLPSQNITFYFTDRRLANVESSIERVITILERTTKIDATYWSYSNGWTLFEEAINGVMHYEHALEFEIDTNDITVSKMDSLLKLLDYDNTETFKTIFNEWSVHYSLAFFMSKVECSFSIGQQGFLIQESIFDESSMIQALGGGVLYTIQYGDEIDRPRTFCNDTVC